MGMRLVALWFVASASAKRLKWTFRPNATLPCESSVAVRGRDVFVADAASVYRLDGASGGLVWRAAAPNDADGSFSPSVAARRGGAVVVVPTASSLRAFDADSGAELWSVPAPEGLPLDGCASFLSDGSVAFATGSWGDDANGGVVAVDAATGAARWRFDVPRSEPTRSTRGIWAKPLVFNDTTVVVGDFGGRLWALDAATGRARWSFQERRDATGLYGDEIWAPVAVTPRNELVFTSNLGWIRKLDPASGAELVADAWPVAPARRANDSASPLAGDPIVFSAPLVDAAGTVYVAAENWCVYAFAADGTAAWRNCDFCSWGSAQGRTRVIQRRFNVSVPRAPVLEKASTLRDRSER